MSEVSQQAETAIIVRGVAYPNKEAIADAFRVSVKTVSQAIRRGRLQFIGLHASKTRARTGPKSYPIEIRGVIFSSPQEAADACGVSVKTIHSALYRGRLDYVGVGTYRDGQALKGRTPKNAVPTQIGNKIFPTIRDAAAYLGCTHGTFLKRRNDPEWLLRKCLEAEHGKKS